jgi:rSAM/selenodomain-associated transferase 1
MTKNTPPHRTQFGVFAKYWRPGAVKTRLAKSIGEVPASQIYKQFLTTIVSRFSEVCDLCTLSVSPVSDHVHFHQLQLNRWQLVDQGTGDLGQRMHNYFADSFAKNTERVLLIGSDSPNLPVRFVDQALQELENNDIVLGPTEDGGYYLIGMKRLIGEVFEGIAWSTQDVWSQTVAILQRQNVSFGQLPTWYDVDNGQDLERLQRDLKSRADDERLLALHDRIAELLG